MTKQKWIVEEDVNIRIDKYLSDITEHSRTRIQDLADNNLILVNDKPVKSSYKVVLSDVITCDIPELEEMTIEKENIPLDILYEDSDIIVINKPSGLLSIASDNEKSSTAYRMLSDYVQQKDKHNRIFVVHRLDEDTSGVLMVAKNVKIQQALQNNWNDIVKKRGYYAIVEGEMEKKSDTIKSYLKKNSQNLMYSSKKAGDGQLAITHYKVIKSNGTYSLLDVNIDTGRKNQIRVHLGEKGHYIIGDDKYGKPANPIKRLGLHAYELDLIHPLTGKLMKFTSPMPKEFGILMDENNVK